MQEESNVEKKEKGESLSGGESSAEYMAAHAGEEEEGSRKEGEIEKDTEDMGDKIMAGAKALKKKVEDPDKDLKTEYEKEKIKE